MLRNWKPRLAECAICLTIVLLAATLATGSLLPPKFPDTVVALGSMRPIVLRVPGQPCIEQCRQREPDFYMATSSRMILTQLRSCTRFILLQSVMS